MCGHYCSSAFWSGRRSKCARLFLQRTVEIFDKVKAAVLRAYELVPEVYRQKFRRLRTKQDQTFVEFVREKVALFDRWCLSSGVTDFNEPRQLVPMEGFKNCLPEVVSTSLNEHKATDVFKAAVLVHGRIHSHT